MFERNGGQWQYDIVNTFHNANQSHALAGVPGYALIHPGAQVVINKTCGTWCIEFFDDSKQWQSLTFKDIRNKSDAEKRLTLFISDRERGQLKLPRKKTIPTLAEYANRYLEL